MPLPYILVASSEERQLIWLGLRPSRVDRFQVIGSVDKTSDARSCTGGELLWAPAQAPVLSGRGRTPARVRAYRSMQRVAIITADHPLRASDHGASAPGDVPKRVER